ATALIGLPSVSLSEGSSTRSVVPSATGANSIVASTPEPLAPGGGGGPREPQPKCSFLIVPSSGCTTGGGPSSRRPVLPINGPSVADTKVTAALSNVIRTSYAPSP